MLSTIVLALATGLFGVHAATAQNQQGRFEITPFIGVYIPLADVVESGAITPTSTAARHEVDLMVGGKLTYWFQSQMGVEAELLYAPNALESEPFGIAGPVDAEFLAVTARLVYDFGGDPARPSILLTGGLGFFATSYDDPLDMTTGGLGLVGLGLRIPLGTVLAIRFDVSDYLTTTEWELTDGGKTDPLLQNDLTITGGLTLSLGR
jgi:hypothetical protein